MIFSNMLNRFSTRVLVTIQLTFLVLAFLKNNGVATTQIPVPKITEVAFSSDECLWLLLRNGYIKKSSDFGNTWITSDAAPFNIEHFFFLSQDLGWAVSRNGAVWQYTKSKDIWEPISKLKRYSGSPFTTFQVHFVNKDRGYIVALWHVYATNDGGKTWKNKGLANSQHIGRISIDPKNSDIVYVAAYGALWNSSSERGIYKTTDGGKTWKQSLFVSDNTGFNDVLIDNKHPNIIYAAAHQRRRHEYTYISGGPESALYKSVDEGATW